MNGLTIEENDNHWLVGWLFEASGYFTKMSQSKLSAALWAIHVVAS
ncbi:hypothetical protein [Bartonella phoceensis]|nr:hypothetical protein [Bartonella phoceensis]